MSHTYVSLFYHITWSTKKRYPLITKELRPSLYDCIKSLVQEQKGACLFALGGTFDHVHILIKTSNLISIPTFMRTIKCRSSKFVAKINKIDYFSWQTGYGIFSVSPRMVPKTQEYIYNQEKHHRVFDYEKELEMLSNLSFLKVPGGSTTPRGRPDI